jgi:uncharacterized OB-fold protein
LQDDLPYTVAIVELEEGPRFLSRIIGCQPEDVACDLKVELVWEDRTKEICLPLFQPLGAGIEMVERP